MIRLRNGTLVERDAEGSRVTLPCGATVLGHPHSTGCYRATAERLGYGADVTAMALDHDPLHCIMTDFLGLPYSFGLMCAAGLRDEDEISSAEEEFILAAQKFVRMVGVDVFSLGYHEISRSHRKPLRKVDRFRGRSA